MTPAEIIKALTAINPNFRIPLNATVNQIMLWAAANIEKTERR